MVWVHVAVLCSAQYYSPWNGFQVKRGLTPLFGSLLALTPWAALVGIALYLIGDLTFDRAAFRRGLALMGIAGGLFVFYPAHYYLLVAALPLLITIIAHEEDWDEVLDDATRSTPYP